MASSTKSFLALALLAAADLVAGHGAIIAATGNAGGSGSAIGIDPNTPRDGTRRNPFQMDSTRFRGAAADTFGETVGAGTNNLEAGTKKVMELSGDKLPQVTPGGSIDMTLHQVNADGAGPYSCSINADGTGATWTDIQVTTQVPGTNSRSRAGATTDFPLAAAIPAGQTCTGTVAGESNVCLVRCENGARAGPFGGIVPVQMASADAAPAKGGAAPAKGAAKGGAAANKGAAKGAAPAAPAAPATNTTTEAAAGAGVEARWERLRVARVAVAQKAAAAQAAAAAAADEDEDED